MSEVRFDYRLTGAGWSKAEIRIGPVSASLSASYLDDALGELLAGVLAMARGAEQVRVSWTEEPGEFRWVLTARGDAVDVRIVWFADMWSDAADDEGDERLRATCSLASLCAGVADGARVVLTEHGAAGYWERWRHDFPAQSLAELEAEGSR